MRLWFLAAAAVMFSASAHAQTPAATSTKAGVYTREQSGRGQDVYAGYCKNCHTPESHTGAVFKTKWSGRRLSELYEYIRDQMPKNDPGSLSPEEYADVLAYLLQLNRMPAGRRDLSNDVAALKSIRIETTKMPVRKGP
jgi:S-disulfanyl-L-cysteine oxidoreductase SoxD